MEADGRSIGCMRKLKELDGKSPGHTESERKLTESLLAAWKVDGS